MVFESIGKSLSNLGKGTMKTGKSMLKSTSKAGKYVTDPLTGVAKKTVRYVPFVNADDDVRNLVHDHYAIELFEDELRTRLNKSIAIMRKAKFPPTKITAIKKSFSIITKSLEHETTLDHAVASVKDMISSLAKAPSIDNTYEDGTWKQVKKVTLTATQQALVKDELTAIAKEVKSMKSSLKSLVDFTTIKPTSTYQSKKSLKGWRAKNHEIIDDLITAKFDIVTQEKKVYYLLLELERKIKKSKDHKNTLTQTQIDDLVSVKIASHQKVIIGLRKSIAALETKAKKNRTTYDTGVDKRLKEVSTWLDTNKKQTTKTIATQKKESKAHDKKLSALRKAYSKASSAIVSKTKAPFGNTTLLQDTVQHETSAYTALAEKTIHRLTDDYAIHLSQEKDIALKNMLVQEHINREYDMMLLNKEQSLQTRLLNRINKKQSSAHNKISAQLKKVRSASKLAGLGAISKRVAGEKTIIATSVKTAETDHKNYNKKIDEQKVTISTWRELTSYLKHENLALGTQSEHDLKAQMMTYLEKDKKQITTAIADQTTLVGTIEAAIKKSEIQQKENERSALTLQDAPRTKKAIEHEKLAHEQEVSLDTLEHHVDLEKDILENVAARLSDYRSETKKLLSKNKKETTAMKKYAKKIKKDALAKKVM